MSSPNTLGDTMRVHDKAVYDWLGGLPIDYGTIAGTARNAFPILRIYANPQRAFGSISDLLVRTGWMAGSTAEEQRAAAEDDWKVLPTPIATIERDDPVLDPLHSGVLKEQRRVYLNPETKQWEFHPWPLAYSTGYHVTFWMQKKFTEAYIREWVYSRFGKPGAQHNELFLHPLHPAPWGAVRQAFRLDGSTNLSDEEGEGARNIRYQYDFTLRTLLFRPPTSTVPIVHAVGVDVYSVDGQRGNADPTETLVGTIGFEATENLFRWPFQNLDAVAENWPALGGATVAIGDRSPGGSWQDGTPSLSIGVKLPTDSVELLERLATPDDDGHAIVSISFAYSSLVGGARLMVAQHELATNDVTSAFELDLPQSVDWKRVHVFALTRDDAFIVTVDGPAVAGADPTEIVVADVDIRQFYDGGRINAQQVLPPSGGETRYQWASLESAPYLVIGVLSAANGGLVTAENDIYAPDASVAQQVDGTVNVGFVMLVQPRAGTLSLRVPSTMALASLYVQRYHGPYNGHTL